MSCPSCGADVPGGARFCPTCGHRVWSRADERRVVTVLFGDLVGFTSMSEHTDPEQVKNFIDRCFERLAADVTAFGGQVDKVIGDAIVALFGAPTAHEDDAERAVRAALRMQTTLERTAAELGTNVHMRIGVNTGEVLVGAIRAGGDYTAMGDVVNTASRLQTAAQPGQVLVGPATHAATQTTISYDAVEPIQVKGRQQPVPAWVALEATAPPGYRPRRPQAPLVGRDVEMELFSGAIRSAVERRRALLCVLTGDAGVGKSRLAAELASLAHGCHSAWLVEGRCLPYGEANPWWPVAEALRRASGITVADSAEAARAKCRRMVRTVLVSKGAEESEAETDRLTEGILYLLGYEVLGLEPDRARKEAAHSVATLLEAVCRSRPVVMVLSDIHWADPAVLDLMDELLVRLSRLPFVLVATSRPGLDRAFTPGAHNVLSFTLDPLAPDAAVSLLHSLVESEPDPELAAMLVERSGGNPFFLEELTALVAAERGSGARGSTSLPDNLRGLVAARLDGLDVAERNMVEDAAVWGRSGPVVALTGGSLHSDVLRSLASGDLLVVDGDRWEFRSDVIREVAYSTLTKAERARRHARLGQWLHDWTHERGRADEGIEPVAHHLRLAAELVAEIGMVSGVPDDLTDRAVSALERAADRSDARDSSTASRALYDAALALSAAAPAGVFDERRWRLRLGRAQAAADLRDAGAARRDLATLLDEAAAAERDDLRAKALVVKGEVEQFEGAFDAASATLAEAVALGRELGDLRTTADALRTSGLTSLLAGHTAGAEAAITEALGTFQQLDDARGQAWAMQNLAWIAFMEGRIGEAEQRLSDALDGFAAINDEWGRGWALGLLGFVRFHQGRSDEAAALARQVIDSDGDRGDVWGQGMMHVLLASIALWDGRTVEAAAEANGALERFRSLEDSFGLTYSYSLLIRSLAALGQFNELASVRAATDGMVDGSGPQHTMVWLADLAASVNAGDGDRAVRLADQRLQAADGFDAEIINLEQLVNSALALMLGNRDDDARTLLAHVSGHLELVGPFANAGAALVEAATGRPETAIECRPRVLDAPQGTYLDKVMVEVACALAFTRLGRADEAIDAAAQAIAHADRSEDRLARLMARLVRAEVLGALHDPAAGAAAGESDRALAALGLVDSDWCAVFCRSLALVASP